MKYYIALLCCFLCFACVEQVEEQPDGKKLVLIYGFISPGADEIKVSVSETISIFDNSIGVDSFETADRLIIKDAEVYIENASGEEVQLTYDDTSKRYIAPTSSFAINAGEKYLLRVLANEQEFTSSCIVPAETITDIETTLGIEINEFGSRENNIKIRFNDISGGANFYIVGAKYRSLNATEPDLFSLSFGLERFATDINGDGLAVFSKAQVFLGTETGLEVTSQVAHVDELIYRTLIANFLNSNGDGDPFFQPIPPPNNINEEDGYGVFAGYRLTQKTEDVTL